MSFLSAVGHFFQAVGHDTVKVTQAIAPYAPAIATLPGVGGPFGFIFGTIVHVEQLVGEIAKKGADKKAAVTAMVLLAYPGIDKAALSSAIDGIVKILNDLTKAIPPTPVLAVDQGT